MINSGFTGFTQESIEFLHNLQRNNHKSWFEDHKHLYNEDLLTPTQLLVSELSDFMLEIDPDLETAPAVSKTISRIYRDTRFSKDKSPYRANIWITFKRPRKEWIDAPAFFFELTPESYRYGMGFYSATKDTMDKFRERMDSDPKEFQQATAFYAKQDTFILEGDQYKRLLDPGKPKEMLDWYQRKNLYLVCNRDIDDRLFNHELVQDIKDGFGRLADFYHYLCRIKRM